MVVSLKPGLPNHLLSKKKVRLLFRSPGRKDTKRGLWSDPLTLNTPHLCGKRYYAILHFPELYLVCISQNHKISGAFEPPCFTRLLGETGLTKFFIFFDASQLGIKGLLGIFFIPVGQKESLAKTIPSSFPGWLVGDGKRLGPCSCGLYNPLGPSRFSLDFPKALLQGDHLPQYL
ncbi:unnamed protein product [Cochlearia groenlandica]